MKMMSVAAVVAVLSATTGVAQPPGSPAAATKLAGPVPAFAGLDLGMADLTPTAQAKLKAAGVGDFSLKLSPTRLAGAIPMEGTPRTITSSVSAPKVTTTTTTVTYESVVTRVRSGETVLMAVGVPAPAGYVHISEADAKEYGVVRGLWRAFRGATGNLMERVGAAVAGDYRARWTHPADLRAHLISELHGQDPVKLAGMTNAELEELHDRLHDAAQAKAAPAVAAPRPPLINLQFGGSTYNGGSNCPGGVCPTGSYSPAPAPAARRGLFR